MRPETDDAYLRQIRTDVATRALGMKNLRVSVRSFELVPGDIYLFCTDGLRRALGDRVVAHILALETAPSNLVAELIRRAYTERAGDNVAALVVSCDLAPGSDFAHRPRPPPTPPSPVGPQAPEIVMVPLEPAIAGGAYDELSVVPPESASPEMLDAMRTLISSAPRRMTRTARLDPCAKCGEQVEADAHFCPHCGAQQH
jgi:hypothetical protein